MVYPVNSLFWQLHGVKADIGDLVALLLPGHVEPILLLHGIALALVVAGAVSLLVADFSLSVLSVKLASHGLWRVDRTVMVNVGRIVTL